MPTITVALYGGLGNQMFQYAMGRSMAIQLGAPLQLDLFGFEFDKVYRRKFELEHFNITSEAAIARHPIRFRISRYIRRLAESVPFVHNIALPYTLVEPLPDFEPQNIKSRYCDLYLSGYWQDERYFQQCSTIIRSEMTLKQPLSDANQKVADHIRSAANSVAVHLRRLHGVGATCKSTPSGPSFALPLDYYSEALEKIESRIHRPDYFVFSDNPEWAHDNFPIEDRKIHILQNDRGPDFQEIPLMSLCTHHVIANSSFSWWGAWLGANPRQIVVAPRSAPKYTPNIPSSWLRAG